MKKLVFVSILLAVFTTNIFSQNVPAKLQVRLVLKILSMDMNKDRFGEPIKIGVSSDSILNAFKGASEMKVKGTSFKVSKMSSPGDIKKYGVIYVDKNWSSKYGEAARKAAGRKVLMFCNDVGGIKGGNGAIAFKVIEGKPKIMVNIGNIKKQGSEFPVNFFKMAVIVK